MHRSIVLAVLLAGACAHRGEQVGRELTASIPAATAAVDGYLDWLRAQQRDLVASCKEVERPRDCARAKLTAFRATQAPVIKTLRAVAQPGRTAIAALLDDSTDAPVRVARPGESCTPLVVGRALTAGEVICPIAPPSSVLPGGAR